MVTTPATDTALTAGSFSSILLAVLLAVAVTLAPMVIWVAVLLLVGEVLVHFVLVMVVVEASLRLTLVVNLLTFGCESFLAFQHQSAPSFSVFYSNFGMLVFYRLLIFHKVHCHHTLQKRYYYYLW